MRINPVILLAYSTAAFICGLGNTGDPDAISDDRLNNASAAGDADDAPRGPRAAYSARRDPTASFYNSSYLAAVLRDRGYDVYESGDGLPVVVLGGDIAAPAASVAPDLFPPAARAISAMVHSTWKSKQGRTVVHYFFDKKNMPNQKLFEEAAKAWARGTCISFKKTKDTSCDQKVHQPSFCVGSFGGCWSFVGQSNWGGDQTGLGRPQRLSVSGVCELDACIHEFGHGLGFQHQQSRPDRDEFLTVNYENFKISNAKDWETSLRSTWYQGTICGKSQTQDIPTPYDFLSVMQYGTFDFVDDDIRPTFVTKNPRHQWMLDYHRSMGRGPSHYDYYVMNKAYGCPDVISKMCKSNGKSVPTCTNHGYLTKDCTCKCPEGYRGATCGTKEKDFDIYHLREKAKCSLNWHYPGIIDISNLDLDFAKRTYTNDKFNYMQFCTILVDTKQSKMRPILRVDPSELLVRRKHLMHLFSMSIDSIVSQMNTFDCRLFFKLFWTTDPVRPLRRTECFSSIFNLGRKVKRSKMLTLRGKTPVISLYLNVRYKWSSPAREYLEAAFKLKIAVTFSKIPEKVLQRRSDFSGDTWHASTGTAPTIPPELRFKSTTPNILGIPLPSIFHDEPDPKLAFFSWVIFVLGVLGCAFLAGAVIAERTNMHALMQYADRKAALSSGGANVLATGWVKMRGVDVEEERRKEEEEEKENWFMRIFGIEDSSSEEDSDEHGSGHGQHEAAQEHVRSAPQAGSPHRDSGSSSNKKDSQPKGRHIWQPPGGHLPPINPGRR